MDERSKQNQSGERAAGRAAAVARPRRSATTRSAARSNAGRIPAAAGDAQRSIMSPDQASATYRDDWILMRMTGLPGEPNADVGEVLIHSPHRKDITRALNQAHKRDPAVHLFVFHGGMRSLKGNELRAALEEAAKGPYVNAFW